MSIIAGAGIVSVWGAGCTSPAITSEAEAVPDLLTSAGVAFVYFSTRNKGPKNPWDL